MLRRLGLATVLVLLAVPAHAQRVQVNNNAAHVIVDNCTGCGGGGTVAQGAGGSSAWKVDFGGSAQHIICDSGCGSPPAVPDNAAFTFGMTTVSPIAWVTDDASPHTVADNVYGAARMSPSRIVLFALTNDDGINRAFVTSGQALQVIDQSVFTALSTLLTAQFEPGGVTPTAQPLAVGGLSNDATGKNEPIPLGASGRSVIVEGYAGATAVPTSVASLPLPAGAATAAKQPALGTAGTASADVLTVQGKAAMTPLLVDPSGVTSPVSLASVPSHAVTNAGTFAVQAAESGTWTVQPGNTANTTAWKVDGSAVTQPVNGTVTTTPPANASTNVAQLAGTTTSVNSGAKDAGTLRVVLATDQPALTNKLLVTPDSVALPANQSVNVAQMAGITTSMNTGVRDTGTQRVTIATNDLVPVSGTVTATQGTAAASTAGWPATAGTVARSTATWTSATALNAALTIATTGYATVVVSINDDAGTFTTGGVTFELSDDNAHWYAVTGYLVGATAGASSATLSVSLSIPFVVNCTGFSNMRVRLSTAITGTGTTVVALLASAFVGTPITNSAVTQGTSPWVVSQGTGTNLHVVLDTTSTTAVTQATAANLNATVTQQTLTKGTQGAQGVTTQDLKDAGRTAISFYASAFAAGATATEKIITWDQSSGTGAITAATASYTITSGKRLRITSLTIATQASATATTHSTIFSLRLNTAGACVVTSTPILFKGQSASAAVASAWDRFTIPIPDGYEIAGNGTIALCITANSTFVTNAPTWAVNLIGYEY